MQRSTMLFIGLTCLMVLGLRELAGYGTGSNNAEIRIGKFRGRVVNNIDPLMQGRILVQVPDVSELPIPNWAMPCVPYAGNDVGTYVIPPIGANVWVEFESGDTNLPIWTGCFWGKDQLPVTQAIPTTKVFQTEKVQIRADDLTGSVSLSVETKTGTQRIQLNQDGVVANLGETTIAIDNHGEIKKIRGN